MKTYTTIKVKGEEQYDIVGTLRNLFGYKWTGKIGSIKYSEHTDEYKYYPAWNVFSTDGSSKAKHQYIAEQLNKLNKENPNK